MSEIKKRLNREKKITNESFKLRFGTTNNQNPVTCYIEGDAFITPTEENESFSDDIQHLKTVLRKAINKELFNSDVFSKTYIMDFQLPLSSIKVGKKSFMSFQITLKQKNDEINKFKELINIVTPMITNIVSELYAALIERDYLISPKKR